MSEGSTQSMHMIVGLIIAVGIAIFLVAIVPGFIQTAGQSTDIATSPLAGTMTDMFPMFEEGFDD